MFTTAKGILKIEGRTLRVEMWTLRLLGQLLERIESVPIASSEELIAHLWVIRVITYKGTSILTKSDNLVLQFIYFCTDVQVTEVINLNEIFNLLGLYAKEILIGIVKI